jgi:hypothetical protein
MPSSVAIDHHSAWQGSWNPYGAQLRRRKLEIKKLLCLRKRSLRMTQAFIIKIIDSRMLKIEKAIKLLSIIII